MLTGELTDVRICRVDCDDSYQFAFGYVVSHTSGRYDPGNWFVTSLIKSIDSTVEGLVVETLNSRYLVDAVPIIDIPSAAIANVRMGTPPQVAIDICQGVAFKNK
jgi:hypothetical protein